MTDWLLISCIASFIVAMGIAFILGACVAAGEADDRAERDYADRVVRHGDQHPWADR